MYKADNNTPGDTDLGPNGIAFDEVPVQQFGYVDNGELAHPTQQIAREKMDLLRTIHVHDKKRKVEVAWPTSGEKAVSEYSDKNIFAGAFPWLFPGGFGDLREAPKMAERDWGSRMLYHWDGRFLRTLFAFYANITSQTQNSSTGKWFVRYFPKQCS
jgi:hypothetical protein